jgi:NTP pyrophosphatase (non-canonical NTP hydrolase)
MAFQTRVRQFLTSYGLGHTPQTHALDLASEVGELAKALLEVSDYGRSAPIAATSLEEELGDVLFSLTALAESLDVDLEAALDRALAKYEARIAQRGHCGSRDVRSA